MEEKISCFNEGQGQRPLKKDHEGKKLISPWEKFSTNQTCDRLLWASRVTFLWIIEEVGIDFHGKIYMSKLNGCWNMYQIDGPEFLKDEVLNGIKNCYFSSISICYTF